MTGTRKVVLGIVGGIVLVALAFACVLVVFMIANRQSAIDCTLEWGRLAPFPASAEQFSITTHGNMFTREFRASFIASPTEIERWLKESPGTRQAVPTTPFPNLCPQQLCGDQVWLTLNNSLKQTRRERAGFSFDWQDARTPL